jgi:aryl-alcohol dehydrogenase-like predicted oxidoreductase
MIPKTRIPKTNLDVSRLALGCVTFGREIDQTSSFAVLDHALESGITLFDTAEAYGGGQARATRLRTLGVDDQREVSGEMHSSELILGRWMKARRSREKIVLQTKVTPPHGKQRILDSIDASLKRLGTDVIDIFMFHAPDPKTPLIEGLHAIGIAQKAGKIRHVGCSNFSTGQIHDALELAAVSSLPRIVVTQPIYNLAVRDIEDALLPACKKLGVAVEAHSPLGAGFLTGKYDPVTRKAPPGSRFDVLPAHTNIYFHDEKFRAVSRLHALSASTGIPVPLLAVAWVWKNSEVDVVLMGARTTQHIDNAIRATSIQFDSQWDAQLR